MWEMDINIHDVREIRTRTYVFILDAALLKNLMT